MKAIVAVSVALVIALLPQTCLAAGPAFTVCQSVGETGQPAPETSNKPATQAEAQEEGGYKTEHPEFYPARWTQSSEFKAIFAEVDSYFQQRKLGETEDKLHEIINKHPDDADVLVRAYMMLGHEKLIEGEYGSAIQFYQKAYGACPNDSAYLTLKGLQLEQIAKCYERMGKNEEAIKVYLNIIKDYPQEKVDEGVLSTSTMPLRVADAYVRDGRLQDAISYLTSVLKKDDNSEIHPMILQNLAIMYGAEGDFAKSKDCLTKIIRDYPDSQNQVRYSQKALNYIEENGRQEWQENCSKMLRLDHSTKGLEKDQKEKGKD